MRVSLTSTGKFMITCQFRENSYIQRLPAKRFDKVKKAWIAPVNRWNSHTINQWPDLEITSEANIKAIESLQPILPQLEPFPWHAYHHHGPEPMPHQRRALELAWRYDSFALLMEVGCVAEDTMIQLNRSGASRMVTIGYAYYLYKLQTSKYYRTKSLVEDRIRHHDIVGIYKTGEKECLKLTLDDGKTLTATPDHKILTSTGWFELQHLTVGQEVMINGKVNHRDDPTQGFKTYTWSKGFIDKDGYRLVSCRSHPRSKKYGAMYEHILVAEKKLGRWITKEEHVHHIDGDRANNDPENLEVLSEKEHLQKHLPATLKSWIAPHTARVVSVQHVGVRRTYDIAMAAPYNNYIANGIVVHNTAKTKIAIDLACMRYRNGEINRVLVVCPLSIRSNWAEEIDRHSPIREYSILYPDKGMCEWKGWKNTATKDREDHLRWALVGIESLSASERTRAVTEKFVQGGRTMMVVDESSRIKSPDAIRTKVCIELGQSARFRMILNGTPIAHGPLDFWAQFEFLNPKIIDIPYTVFKYTFAIFGGYMGRQILGYQRTNELLEMVKPFVYQVLKKDVLHDLPPKMYEVRRVPPSKEQKEFISKMRKGEVYTRDGNGKIPIQNVLERMLRMQQVTSGFVEEYRPDTGEWLGTMPVPCPKLTELMEMLEEFEGKAIVWTRFIHDIESITFTLVKQYGDEAVVAFSGQTSEEGRALARQRFQEDPACRFFVSNPATGGLGITLTAATLVVYFSGTFAFIDREQSESRAHRKGQLQSVKIVDLITEGTVDELIYMAVQQKMDIHTYIQEYFEKVKEII